MANATTSLQHRGERLAQASEQLVVLSGIAHSPSFSNKLLESGVDRLSANRIEILQANLGKLCNMTCEHCHVDAGPDRREIMQLETVNACIEVLQRHPQIGTLDLTGGAPEMNPHFRDFVVEARRLGRHVIDRCNLTILMAQGFDDLPEFLAENHVEVVASLPCYLEENTDSQRGNGAFAESIRALNRLNDLGYGAEDSGRTLTLVFNPVGASLPPGQSQLEADYRRELGTRYGVRFNRLFTITNMPISRFLDHLTKTGSLEQYMRALVDAFNPATIDGLMCRNTLSVGWDGRLYDCDFNQMLDLEVMSGGGIDEFRYDDLSRRRIVVGRHCFGCTAGAGSGCRGAISKDVTL
jgi:radical SAM/Cys-rich protein